MFTGQFSAWVNAHKLCDSGQQIEGNLDISQLPKLRSYLLLDQDAGDETSPVISAQLIFSRDDKQRMQVIGNIQAAHLPMQCQRCVQTLLQDIQAPVKVVIAAISEEMDNSVCEVWEVADASQLDLLAMLDQELVLALPIVSMHQDCSMPLYEHMTPSAEINQVSKTSPFAGLSNILNQHRS